jgi:hypothetical protein
MALYPNQVYYGDQKVMDISDSTVTPETLGEGETAYDATGKKIAGKMPTTAVLYSAQTLTDAQKAQARQNIGIAPTEEIVQQVLESIGTPVFGIVDENNNIILNGELGDGTYSVKYEMEDGSTVNIGNLVVDNNVYYSVTNNLTQCTNSNSATEVVEGESYSATITAKSGYELKSVAVTMGGSPVTVSGGVIDIANVTGNIVITAVAEEIKAKYTNLADPTSADWADGKRFNGSGALTNVDAGVNGATTNYIGGDLATGDVIRIKGIDLTTYRTVVYDKNKNIASVGTLAGQTTYFSDITVNSTGASFKIKSGMPSGGYIRFCGPLNGTSADVIITKNEEIV